MSLEYKSLPLIVAHRGASAIAPENTLTAFRQAIDAGAEGIEFDVRLAKDGIPVVIHDAKLKRTARTKGKVSEFTSAELAGMDVASWFHLHTSANGRPAHAEFQGIPTLASVLDRFKDYRGRIYVELKCKENDVEPLVRAASRTLLDSPLAPQVTVKSFRLSAIPLLRTFAPEIRTAALFAPKIMTVLRKEKYLVKLAAEFGVDEISLHYSLATRKLVRKAEKHGLPVAIWTADSPHWVKRAVSLGIKAIITNDPARLLARRAAICGNYEQ